MLTYIPASDEVRGVYDPSHPLSIAMERLALKAMALRDHLRHWVDVAETSFETSDHAWKVRALPDTPTHRFEGRVTFDAPPVKQAPYVAARRHAQQADYLAHGGIADMAILALVAAFDAFLGEALTARFSLDDRPLRDSHITLTAEEVLDSQNHREIIIDKLRVRILRDSRQGQAKEMQRYTRTPLDQITEWPAIERLSELRNVIAHNGSVPSARRRRHLGLGHVVSPGAENPDEQYERVVTTPGQFEAAAHDVIVTSVKVAHLMWRGSSRNPTVVDQANADLSQLAYSLLAQEEWELAKRLLEHACDIVRPVGRTESDGLRFIVNLAQAYKWSGDEARCRDLLGRHDWSAKDIPFRLSHSVLLDDFERAADLMERAASNGGMDRSAFDYWPVFRAFRFSSQFQEVYLGAFGGP